MSLARPIPLLTKHGKLAAIAPAFKEGLGAEVVLVDGFDTDALGTFTPEIPRPGTQLEMARRKARLAADLAGLPRGIGSEGAFGPDPFGVVPWNLEIVAFVDDELGLDVVGVSQGPTRMAHRVVDSWEALSAAAREFGFPDHGLVVRPATRGSAACVKGIVDPAALRRAFDAVAEHGPVLVEHDLRAHLHPVRMERIAEAARDLVGRLARPCPACACPGWGPVGVVDGLPCRACGGATPGLRADRWACARCRHTVEVPRPGPDREDPGRCPWCNP